MTDNPKVFRFDQLHIDVARNSTDDFNPFHDPKRWLRIAGNPFGSTIALGFQLEFLVAHLIGRRRLAKGENEWIQSHGLHFTNYEFLFAGALQPGEEFGVEVRETRNKVASGGGLSNRAVVRKSAGALVLLGTQDETANPLFLGDIQLTGLPPLDPLPDRSALPGTPYFLKRKFMHTSNGKNFALASLVDPHDYFDEPVERVQFPPIFSAALLSSALLENAWREEYDFTADPLVYTSHQISVDRRLQRQLRSNDRLHILVEGPLPAPQPKGLGRAAVAQTLYRCFGLVLHEQVLFRAKVRLAPLHALLKRS
jgi:hypothetical protein